MHVCVCLYACMFVCVCLRACERACERERKRVNGRLLELMSSSKKRERNLDDLGTFFDIFFEERRNIFFSFFSFKHFTF